MVQRGSSKVVVIDARLLYIVKWLYIDLKHCGILSRHVIRHQGVLLLGAVDDAPDLSFQEITQGFELQRKTKFVSMRTEGH